MAHNARIRPAGTWFTGTPITQDEMEAFDLAQFQAINGDLGGTWAPSSQIVIGGSGLHVTGDAKLDAISNLSVTAAGTVTIADGATVTIATDVLFDTTSIVQIAHILEIENTGHIDVIDGGFIGIDASSALNLSGTMTVASGAVVDLAAGGILNITGTANIQSGGVLEAKSGSNIVVDSGANIEVAGHLKLNNGSVTDFFNGSTTTFASGSALSLNGPVTVAGAVTQSGAATISGMITRSGAGGRTRRRIDTSIVNANSNITVAADTWYVTNSSGSPISVTVKTTGTVPQSGERITIRNLTATSAITVACEVAGNLITFAGGGNIGGCEVEFDGTRWRIVNVWELAFSSVNATG